MGNLVHGSGRIASAQVGETGDELRRRRGILKIEGWDGITDNCPYEIRNHGNGSFQQGGHDGLEVVA